ncbi:glycosyltransferase family 2 protein [Bacillus marasmi]|uniref:glycosyltransferase family 2 protein n=1 Tax=Bacillus marasmi TaxID=1926279 RepID=UPI0011C978AA|nr:glycosyltransferase [Bacillus marasmi]
MQPFISLCMIVKNEEKVLERCLDSVFGIVDEIIIVDTGSTDCTKEIASKYTDKIYDFNWDGSFSNARNFAQKFARGVWILALDADEYVDRENLCTTIDSLKEIIDSKSRIDALSVKIINFTGSYGENIIQHHHSRIYINDGTVKYYRDIHEQLEKTDDTLIRDKDSSLVVYHSGYLNYVVKNKEKNKRNTMLIESEMKKSGESGFDYFNMGNELQSLGKIEEALDAYKKAFIKKPDIGYSWVPYTIIQIINCLIRLTRYNEALDVIADAQQMYSNSPDFQCLKSNIYISQFRFEDAKDVLIEIINNKDNYDKCILSEDYLELIPHKFLGMIYEREENYEKAIEQYSHALSYNTTNLEIITRILFILSKYNCNKELKNFIDKQKWTARQEITKAIIKVLLNNNNIDLAKSLCEFINTKKDIVGINMKSELVNGNFNDAYNRIKNRSIHDLNDLLSQNWIDFFDLLILALNCKETNLLKLFGNLITNSDEKLFVSFLLEGSIDTKMNNPVYLVSLMEKAVLLQQFELFESLIPLKKFYDESINLLIGHMLYKLHFEEIAISFYQEIDSLEKLDDEAMVNTIKEFIKREEINDAIEFSLLAINQNRNDFRIFKYGIELTEKVKMYELRDEFLKLALQIYPDSKWLQGFNVKCKKIDFAKKTRVKEYELSSDRILLSIIIPAYNAGKYIRETIESALTQTIDKKEVIIVNDGSSDNTLAIINKFSHLENVKVFDNVINRGANYTYNYGLLQAKGEYVTFLDADDVYLPEYCEKVINEIEMDQADLGFANLFVIDGTSKLTTTLYGQPRDPRFNHFFEGPNHQFPDGEMLRKLILKGAHVSPRSVYKRELFHLFGLEDYRLRIAHDWLRHIRFILNGAKCVFVEEPLGYYRIHPEGNSQKNPQENNVENLKVMEIVEKELFHVLSEEERFIMTMIKKNIRVSLFSSLADSNLPTSEIIKYLVNRKFDI